MGCGISKFDIQEEGEASPYPQVSLVHRRNDRAVVDSSLLSKPLPEGGRGEEHAKGVIQHMKIKEVKSEEKGGIQRERVEKEEACDKEDSNEDEDDRDDSNSYLRSPSFRVYCILPLSDDENSEGDSNPGKRRDKQQGQVKDDKGSSARWGKRGRIGKGIKTGSARVKSILRV
ncbi:uncharacterized protein LOC111299498 [Durio zibethinus]|uniref:Uncharacterized protein LOC111299498 n=1 Tax=Durio zibethinus TaxID=66656 RepID=A0A6P5ZD89_DURZI|nr:uncharacterized protein LOC111299498 [Durio zibethinus]